MKYAIAAALAMVMLSGCAVNLIHVNDAAIYYEDNATSANNTINESNVANRKGE